MTARRRTRLEVGTLLGALALAATAAGCRTHEAAASTGCTQDKECPGDYACVATACIARDAPPGMWSVELVPPNDSTAAATEINNVVFDGGPVTW
ncbi:MAG TPA: hypothetical protein VMU50_16210, partial [Polyangia bacterium]|nr:hypothetical protein [Polyangia bacterium]